MKLFISLSERNFCIIPVFCTIQSLSDTTSSSKHRTCSQREICLLIHLGGYTLVILQSSTSSKRTQNREIFLYPDVLYAWSGNRSGPEKVMPMLTIPPKYYCCSVKQSVNCREVHRIKSEIARNTD